MTRVLCYGPKEKPKSEALADADLVLQIEEHDPKKKGPLHYKVLKARHGKSGFVVGPDAQKMLAQYAK